MKQPSSSVLLVSGDLKGYNSWTSVFRSLVQEIIFRKLINVRFHKYKNIIRGVKEFASNALRHIDITEC